VYWGPETPDGFGDGTYPAPVEINCRWLDEQILFKSDDGEEHTSKAMVIVGQVTERGGWLFFGLLTDLVAPTDDPKEQTGAYEILQFDSKPTLRANELVQTAFL